MLTIKILGTGCPNCKKLEAITRQAAAGMGVEAEVTTWLATALEKA
jgi:hypothetical protein